MHVKGLPIGPIYAIQYLRPFQEICGNSVDMLEQDHLGQASNGF